jgi:TPR repeat protein
MAGMPTSSNTRNAPRSAVPDDTVTGSLRPPAQPGQLQPTSTISSADEARLIDRAEFMIKQSDFAGARLLLEHALDKGSARAAFVMAETYDWRMLHALQPYGVRGDSEKAREFYELAAAAGVEKALERLEALKSSSDP